MSTSTKSQVPNDPNCALNGWHPGEEFVQSKMNLPARVSLSAVVNHLPEQHRLFHSTRLHFLPTTTLDAEGRPWVSILTGQGGELGYIDSPHPTELNIDAATWDHDPILDNLDHFTKNPMRNENGGVDAQKTLISGIGIEVATRRRNKFAGSIHRASLQKNILSLSLDVNQALGLCPKYINVRQLKPHPQTAPRMIHHRLHMDDNEHLPDDVIAFIHNADTTYIGTSYVARPEDAKKFPSHVNTNHRGGRPGFVRVRPSDARTLVLPNYAGNRLMNSLGNIHITPLASLAFPSFATGSILYVTGTATNHFGAPARALMPQSSVCTSIRVTGYTFISAALPLRDTGSTRPSPYTPPVRYLAEEEPPRNTVPETLLKLESARVHMDTLLTLTFASPHPLEIKPAQNAVLALSDFLRTQVPKLIKWEERKDTANDDGVRTWTVSVPPTPEDPCRFKITMRVIKGGLITPIIYDVVQNQARKLGRLSPESTPAFEQDIDLTPLELTAPLRGIGGDLPVPTPLAPCDGSRQLLWLAGGIGLTPFLGLTRYIARGRYGAWDIVLVLSAREPEVMLKLVGEALEDQKKTVSNGKVNGHAAVHSQEPAEDDELDEDTWSLAFTIHVFTSADVPDNKDLNLPPFVKLIVHKDERVGVDSKGSSSAQAADERYELGGGAAFFRSVKAAEREAHICGPLPFVTGAMQAMAEAGVDQETVKRERFTY